LRIIITALAWIVCVGGAVCCIVGLATIAYIRRHR
jgi:hypothetical protein